MPYIRPSLQDLIDRANADIESRLPGSQPRLRRSVLGVIGRVLAGAHHGLYGFINFLANQVLPDTAETEWLERHASIWGLSRKAASKAGGNVGLTGTNGSVVPSGTELQTADGVQYVSTAEATIAAGVASVAIEATAGGVDGNQAASVTLSFVSPVAGVDATATVDGGALTGGADAETDDDLRARVISRIQQPPHGGADFDYTTWALEVAGVTRAWVYPQELGIGTVTVRFMMDDTYADGIPLAADVTDVQNYIDALRPVTADLTVVAPTSVPLNFTISGLSPSTTAIKAAIEDELKDLITREAEPGGTILISHIREAISIAAGEVDHVLDSPVADVTHTTGQIATFGAITWV
nr:tail protein [Gammaproteobacteria bacterium]